MVILCCQITKYVMILHTFIVPFLRHTYSYFFNHISSLRFRVFWNYKFLACWTTPPVISSVDSLMVIIRLFLLELSLKVCVIGCCHQMLLFSPLWKATILPTMRFFSWIMFHHHLPTRSLLAFFNIVSLDDAKCPNCDYLETQNHILMHCPESYKVWCMVFKWMDIHFIPLPL